MMSKVFSTMLGARPSEGSSNITSFGRDMRAREIASICCSPPESVPAACSRALGEDREALVEAVHVGFDAGLVLAQEAAHSRFSRTVM
jgi:hypothetical protein